MGASSSTDFQYEKLESFKNLPPYTLTINIHIPERAENRRPTNQNFLKVFLAAVLVLLPFLIYSMSNGNFEWIRGYGHCGNICCEKNSNVCCKLTTSESFEWQCTGSNLTDKSNVQCDSSIFSAGFDKSIMTKRRCTTDCGDGNILSLTYCLDEEFTTAIESSLDDTLEEDVEEDYEADLRKHAWRIVLSCFISFGVALGIFLLFRFATTAVVWSTLGCDLTVGAIFICWCWYTVFDWEFSVLWTIWTIAFTGLYLCGILVMVALYDEILLVIQLLKESMKAIFAMPAIILLPILKSICSSMILALFFFNNVSILTSKTLTGIMVLTSFFNSLMAYWAVQFLTGILHMVIAGAVATWYWTKNKNEIDRPVLRSTSIVFYYHLGSIAFGSMLITIAVFLRALSAIKRQLLRRCCLSNGISFLKYISKNSYILTAMHGKPFYESGKRAVKIMLENAKDISSVNFFGCLVMFTAYILIGVISRLIHMLVMLGASDSSDSISYIVVCLVSFFVAMSLLSPIETTLDTILLCYCEDTLLNDGITRPYAMSRVLMESVEKTKKASDKKKDQVPVEKIGL